MNNNLKFVLFILAISVIVLISGCTQSDQLETPVCGNGILESGEQCDVSGCSSGKVCTAQCVCESSIPTESTPPPWPD